MNKTVWLATLALATLAAACAQEQTQSLKDTDGNAYTARLMAEKKVWMADNLNLNVTGSSCYDDEEANCKRYGRLYTWNLAGEACNKLGNGWRLPTDKEWQHMAEPFGGIHNDSGNDGKKTYTALIPGGIANFNVAFGGRRDANAGPYARKDAHGFYWTSTEIDPHTAWFYNLGTNGQMLTRHDGEKATAISVRCIRG
jgi:uncharacterized protein (TIGR02145 family)